MLRRPHPPTSRRTRRGSAGSGCADGTSRSYDRASVAALHASGSGGYLTSMSPGNISTRRKEIFDWLGEVLPEVTQAGRLGSRKVTNFRQCPVRQKGKDPH